MARSKQVKFTVSPNDQLVLLWLDLQSKPSVSIVRAIREYISTHGISDFMEVNIPTPEQLNLMQSIMNGNAQAVAPQVVSVQKPIQTNVKAIPPQNQIDLAPAQSVTVPSKPTVQSVSESVTVQEAIEQNGVEAVSVDDLDVGESNMNDDLPSAALNSDFLMKQLHM